MFKGTTPTIIWELDSEVDLSSMKEIWATVKSRTITLTKKTSELEIDTENNTVKLDLTQEDTLQFKDDEIVELQLRLLDVNDKAYVTSKSKNAFYDILEGGVIS